MTAKLTIAMDDGVLAALAAGRAQAFLPPATRTADAGAAAPREGSHPARLMEWAATRGREFGTKEVEKLLGLTRAHASMLLSRCAGTGHIARIARGRYAQQGTRPIAPPKHGAPWPKGEARPGGLPARLVEWASKLGGEFGATEVRKEFRIKQPGASALLFRMARAGQVVRLAQGRYAAPASPPEDVPHRPGRKPAKATLPHTKLGPRKGSLPAKVLEYASKCGKDFGTADIEKKFGLSRAHASMLLSTMAKAGRIERASRGVYRAGG